jgi:quercetin dioxygenase-like cupin family protein
VNCSRRDLAVLFPVLAASNAFAQQEKSKKGPSGPPEQLRSKTYDFKELKPAGAGARPAVTIFNGITTRGQQINMHLSEVGPGLAPHPPHQHLGEELLVIIEGTLEVEIGGKSGEFGHGKATTLSPGSVAYFASNDPHGMRNVGTTTARYYILGVTDHS